jgi:hypothetical protein
MIFIRNRTAAFNSILRLSLLRCCGGVQRCVVVEDVRLSVVQNRGHMTYMTSPYGCVLGFEVRFGPK